MYSYIKIVLNCVLIDALLHWNLLFFVYKFDKFRHII